MVFDDRGFPRDDRVDVVSPTSTTTTRVARDDQPQPHLSLSPMNGSSNVYDGAAGTNGGGGGVIAAVDQQRACAPSPSSHNAVVPPVPLNTMKDQQRNPAIDSDRSLTEDEKAAEKARLQTLVNKFAKRAVRGCPCEHVDVSAGTRIRTRYQLDSTLEHLNVASPVQGSAPVVSCPIGAIEDIYSMAEDGETAFPPEVLGAFTGAEHLRKNLLMIVYQGPDDGRMHRFYIVEDDEQSRDIFLECLRILCIYSQSGE